MCCFMWQLVGKGSNRYVYILATEITTVETTAYVVQYPKPENARMVLMEKYHVEP